MQKTGKLLLASVSAMLLTVAIPAGVSAATLSPSGDTSGKTDYQNFSNALANDSQVTFSSGTYYMNQIAKLAKSNVSINATGATINMVTANKGFLMMDASKTNGGDSAFQNISVTGGTWNGNTTSSATTLFGMYHTKDITFDGLTFNDTCKGHMIELAGCSDATVKNCTIKGNFTGGDNRNEAIQIDTCFKSMSPSSAPFDNTACSDITIANNNITYSRGTGTHAAVAGHWHKNLTFTGNTIVGTQLDGISVLCAYGVDIKDNTITANGQYAIEFKSTNTSLATFFQGDVKTDASNTDYDVEISGNHIISAKKKAIRIYGSTARPVSDVEVTGNTIDTSGETGIYMERCSDSSISNNIVTQVTNSAQHGIQLYNGCTNCTVSGNTVGKATNYGITAAAKSNTSANRLKNITISSNKVSNTAGYGINVKWTDKASITKNTVKSAKTAFVYANGSSAVTIKSNKFTGTPSGNAIGLASVTGSADAKICKALKVNELKSSQKKITGSCDSSSTIKVTYAGKTKKATRSGSSFKLSIPKQKKGSTVKVTQTDKKGNVTTVSIKVK